MKNLLAVVLICGIAAVNAQIAKGATKFLGNITTNGQIRSDFLQYWNQITGENECKWGSIEGTRNSMNWSGCDRIYNYSRQNKIPMKFHTLIWGAQYPSWMDGLSQADQLKEITEWMDLAKNRYPDLEMIDVVNEAVPGHAPAPYKDALGGNGATGYDWIITAFRMARQRWPKAILIYNDYNEITWQKTQFIDLMNKIKGSGYVDAMGFQAHGWESLSATDLKSRIDEVANSVGLPIFISEYDVNKASDTEQLNIYKAQFPVFWEHPRVAGVTLWGYIVGSTWIANSGLITSAGVERPAFTWLKSYVAGKLNVPNPLPIGGSGSTNSKPVFSTSANVTVDENKTAVVRLEATDANNDPLTYWILGGADASKFTLNASTRDLSFVSAPDFENPGDANRDNVYEVTVAVRDGKDTTTLAMRVTVRDVNETPKGPYGGRAHAVPGLIEAEHYDEGGEGKGFHEANALGNQGGATLRNDEVDIETTRDSSGGYNIGYTLTGEWLEYTVNVAATKTYILSLRVATNGANKTMHVEVDGNNVTGAIAVPNTNDWQIWTTVTKTVNLTAGQRLVRVVFDSDYINLNWIRFEEQNPVAVGAIARDNRVLVGAQDGNIYLKADGHFRYIVRDMRGTVVLAGSAQGIAQVGNALTPGMYQVEINRQGQVFRKSVVKF